MWLYSNKTLFMKRRGELNLAHGPFLGINLFSQNLMGVQSPRNLVKTRFSFSRFAMEPESALHISSQVTPICWSSITLNNKALNNTELKPSLLKFGWIHLWKYPGLVLQICILWLLVALNFWSLQELVLAIYSFPEKYPFSTRFSYFPANSWAK